MATRPPRLIQPHTYFHITSRGTNRWNIFLDALDRHRFLQLLRISCSRHRVDVHAYCLMGNHLHLVVYCSEPTLSAAMRDLKSRYAKYYNRRHRGSGPVFEAPFVEVPILGDEHLMRAIRYVHRNPLDIDPATCLATYRWSSHGIYLGLRPPPAFLQMRITRELFGPAYRDAIERAQPSDKVQNNIRHSVTSPGEVTLASDAPWSIAQVQQVVAQAARCDLGEVDPTRRNGLVGICVVLLLDVATYTASEIAEPLGYRSSNAVHMAARRTRSRLENDAKLQAIYQSGLRLLPAAASLVLPPQGK